MFGYIRALNKKKLEEEVKDPEIVRDLASNAFEIPSSNIVFDSVTNYIFVRDVNNSIFASISLETGDVTLSNPFYEEVASKFIKMYKETFHSLIGDKKIIIDRKY